METEEPSITDNVDNVEPNEKQMNEEVPEEVNNNEYIEDTSEEGKGFFHRISKIFVIRKGTSRKTEHQTCKSVIMIFCITRIIGEGESAIVDITAEGETSEKFSKKI